MKQKHKNGHMQRIYETKKKRVYANEKMKRTYEIGHWKRTCETDM